MGNKDDFDVSEKVYHKVYTTFDRKFNLIHYLNLQMTEINEYKETLSKKFGYQIKNGDALKSWITSGNANQFQKSYLKHINECEKLASKFEGKDIPKGLVHKVLEE